MKVYFYSGLSLKPNTEPHVHGGLMLATSASEAKRKVLARMAADSVQESDLTCSVMELPPRVPFEDHILLWRLERNPHVE